MRHVIMNDQPSDAEVIRQVLAGDTDAFAILVDRYQNEFAGYAAHMTGSADDASDVIQESFVRAYRSLRKCQDPANFKGWLFRIVSNQCKTHQARSRRRSSVPVEELVTAAASHDPEHDVLTSDLRHLVHRAMGRLPPDQREALILKYVQDLGVSEIATMLSISVSALKMRLLRGRQGLVQYLQGAIE